MKSMLLAAAGAFAVAVLSNSPAQARNFNGSSTTSTQVLSEPRFACEDIVRNGRTGDRHDRRMGRGVCASDSIMAVDAGEWALYNNRSWEPDSYNDWWHDRPDRAYPAWMRHNQDCQRMWFAGDTLRC